MECLFAWFPVNIQVPSSHTHLNCGCVSGSCNPFLLEHSHMFIYYFTLGKWYAVHLSSWFIINNNNRWRRRFCVLILFCSIIDGLCSTWFSIFFPHELCEYLISNRTFEFNFNILCIGFSKYKYSNTHPMSNCFHSIYLDEWGCSRDLSVKVLLPLLLLDLQSKPWAQDTLIVKNMTVTYSIRQEKILKGSTWSVQNKEIHN